MRHNLIRGLIGDFNKYIYENKIGSILSQMKIIHICKRSELILSIRSLFV